MIRVFLNKESCLYDVHSLTKAFFQEEEVRAEAVADPWESVKRHFNNVIPNMVYRANKNGIEVTIYRTDIDVKADTKNKSDENEISITLTVPASGIKQETAGTASPQASAEAEKPLRPNASTDGSAESARTEKNTLKQLLYGALCEITGRTLPWGALTGIRPTKIATQMLRDGANDNTIKNYLKNVHFVSDEKALLSIEIARREREILAKRDYENGYSLYVGIPFCPTRCSYCSFAAYPVRALTDDATEKRMAKRYAAMVADYLDALEKELAETARLMRGVRPDTVYIGGGTPTTLTASQCARLLSFLRETFDFTNVEEFTVEAGRPDSILDDPEKLRVLKEHGVNRICVNPQTFSQRTLDLIGRGHTVNETAEAFHAARAAGFDNINMDIILGLPGETPDDVAHTMAEIAKLRPDDLTIHSLAMKRGSKLVEKQVAEAERRRLEAYNRMTVNAERDGQTADGRKTPEKEKRCSRAGEPETDPAYSRDEADRIRMYTEMARIAEDGARGMGLLPYYLYRQKNMTGNMENTGYAREGKAGLTNILGMEEIHSIVACGAGAVTKRVWNVPEGHPDHGLIKRCGNVREADQYIARVDEMIARKRKLFAE